MSEQAKKVTLKYSGLGPVSMPNSGGGVYTIKPGVSSMPADEFEIMRKQPDVKKMLERGAKFADHFDKKSGLGNLVVLSENKKEDSSGDQGQGDDDKKGPVVPGNQGDAKKLVAETEDTALLNSWLESESRAGVKNAIEKKIQEIEAYRLEHGDKE